ncbi:MAG: acyloxyacyl hydrolase [Candidatus Erginobacter occultus]|nr:acyloxyacyl hydrolase [Candidatus Erginobacter occultus]
MPPSLLRGRDGFFPGGLTRRVMDYSRQTPEFNLFSALCPMRRAIFTILILLPLSAFPAKSGEIRQELLGGTYLSTLRNLKTEGATLAYRIAFLSEPGQEFSLFYPGPLSWGFEARGGWLWKPRDTGEAALLLNLSYDLDLGRGTGVFFLVGAGGSYSGANYDNVARHFNFTERAGLGGRFGRCLVQISYEHRSNGGLWSPNRGIDLITAEAGIEF